MDDDERLRTTPRPEPGPLATADTALCHTEAGPGGQEAATGGQLGLLRLRPLTTPPPRSLGLLSLIVTVYLN